MKFDRIVHEADGHVYGIRRKWNTIEFREERVDITEDILKTADPLMALHLSGLRPKDTVTVENVSHDI